jgi:hypothetical protein
MFLGVLSVAVINLGEPKINRAQITWPRAVASSRSLELDGRGFGLWGGITGYPGPNMSAIFKLDKTRGIQNLRLERSLEAAFGFTTDLPVILYDPAERRAWMGPALSIMLPVAIKHPRYYNVRMRRTDNRVLNPSWNSGQAAFEMIFSCTDSEIVSNNSGTSREAGQSDQFHDIILLI